MTRLSLLLFPIAILYQVLAGPLYSVTLPWAGKIAPDLLLVATAAHAVRCQSTSRAILAALLMGLIADALSVDPFLTRTLSFSLLGWVGSGSGRNGLMENPIGRFAYYLAATAVGAGASAGWLLATGFERLIPTWQQGLCAWVYHAALGCALLGLLEPLGPAPRRRQGPLRTSQGGLEWYAGG